jgi:hypothetical protein
MYSGLTVPFLNAAQRSKHYVKHGHRFGAATEQDYERMADEFMTFPLLPPLVECTRITGTFDRVRLNGTTGHYGVAYNILTIRTFHVKEAAAVARRGGPLGFVLHKCAEVR